MSYHGSGISLSLQVVGHQSRREPDVRHVSLCHLHVLLQIVRQAIFILNTNHIVALRISGSGNEL
jgi:hypothetical protein